MIVNSQPKQLRLQDDGHILWQADASNPLPGVPVARVVRGESRLRPLAVLGDADILAGQDRDAVQVFIQSWLHQHIDTVLVVLGGLIVAEGITGPAQDIAQKVHDALGILPRQDVEPLIAGLDPDARRVLRQRHVRLGPVLIFIPELNKPVAVRLRALLWWLWSDRPLPAPVPKDGAVSVVVTDGDPLYYSAIGYPLYAGRAIRVDMLDRVISAVYDNARGGSFKATHAMAEWLGCSIPDLYKILEAMGHAKTHDPADHPAPVPVPVPESVTAPVPAEPAAPEETPVADAGAPAVPAVPVVAVKPDLATFRLKRGRAHDAGRPPRVETAPAPERREKPKFDKKSAGDRPFRPRDGKKGKPVREDKQPLSFEARPQQLADSPFAVLQQLKSGMKDQ